MELRANKLEKPVSGIVEGGLKILLDYMWPGNVRELENAIERAMVTARGAQLTEDDLGFLTRQPNGRKWEVPPNLTMAELEKLAIIATLERTNRNIKAA